MNWYSLVKESSPLPRAIYPDRSDFMDDWEFEDFIDTKERLDKAIDRPTWDDEEGILDYLSSGYFGIVYDLGDRVVKYTSDPNDWAMAEKIEKMQEEHGGALPFVTQLYDYSPVEGSNGKVYRIVMEKIKPLSDFEKENIRTNPKVDGYKQYRKLKQNLKNMGIIPSDLHLNNVGWRETPNGRQLIALDYGIETGKQYYGT